MIEDIIKGVAQVTIERPEESAALALPKDYATALRELANGWEREQQAKAEAAALTGQVKRLEEATAIMEPKAAVYDAVVIPQRCTLPTAARQLRGVNVNAIKRDLMRLGVQWRNGKHYIVRSAYRDTAGRGA